MKDIIVIEIDGKRFGIWKDDVCSDVFAVPSVHGLPFGRSLVAGVAEHEEKMCTFYDPGASLGLGVYRRKETGVGVLITGGERPEGIVFKREVGRMSVEPGDVLKLPDFISTSEIDACIVFDGVPIPVIRIQELLARMSEGRFEPRRGMLLEGSLERTAPPAPGAACVVRIGNGAYAVSGEVSDGSPVTIENGSVCALPFMPERVRGVLVKDGIAFGVLDVAMVLGHRTGMQSHTVLLSRDGGWVLLVDKALERIEASAPDIKEIPQLTAGVFRYALAQGDEVLPCLDPTVLLYRDIPVRGGGAVYVSQSRAGEALGTRDLPVLEFSLLGFRHAVPHEEIKTTVSAVPFRRLPEQGIIIGMALFEGEVVPVLDLAVCFGVRTSVGPDTQMAVYENGDMRALLLAGQWGEKRVLKKEELARLPVSLPHHYVYGCSIADNDVSLILNTMEIALHFMPGEEISEIDEVRAIQAVEEVLEPEAITAAMTETARHAAESHEEEARPSPEPEVKEVEPYAAEGAVTEDEETGVFRETEAESEEIPYSEEATKPESEPGIAAEPMTVGEPEAAEITPEDVGPEVVEELGQQEEMESRIEPGPQGIEPTQRYAEAGYVPKAGPARRSWPSWIYVIVGLFVVLALVYVLAQVTSQRAVPEPPAPVPSERIVTEPEQEQQVPVEEQPEQVEPKKKRLVLEVGKGERRVILESPKTIEVPETLKDVKEPVVYIVKKGDTLWDISERLTGDPYLFSVIAGENEIEDPDLIFPGQQIVLRVLAETPTH